MKQTLILSVIILILLTGVCFSYLNLNNKYKNSLSLIEDKENTINYWKGKDSVNHATIEILKIEKGNQKIAFDKLAKSLNVKPKDINSNTNVTTIVRIPIYLHDTTKINSKYIQIQKDTDYLYVSLEDTMNITNYSKRKHWYSLTKSTFVDVSNVNPFIHINKIKSYEVTSAKPLIIIGPYLGIGYSPLRNTIYPSVGISAMFYPFTYKIY